MVTGWRTFGVLEVRAFAGVGLRLLGIAVFVLLSGCGASTTGPNAQGAPTSTLPQYVSEPFTARQQLVEQGARLIVADGCAVCHLEKTSQALGPSFDDFAGHDVTLADGSRVLVDDRFLREALIDPRKDPLEGYDAAPMIAATRRLHLGGHPQQVAALTAFIEQIGPEPD